MKKLMIAAAIVCAAALSQAAQVSWGTDALMKPTGTDGKYSTTEHVAKTAMGYLWEVQDLKDDQGAIIKTAAQIWAEYAADTSKIYDDFKSGTLGTATASGATKSTGKSTLKGGAYSEGDTAYGLLLYTYTDANNKDWYVANAAKYEGIGTADATVASLNAYEGGLIGGTPQGDAITGWTAAAVPEPTSGLLLLLGVAGLALRRGRRS